MLDCCRPLEDVKREGITLAQAACLSRCNGARVDLHRHGTFTLEELRKQVRLGSGWAACCSIAPGLQLPGVCSTGACMVLKTCAPSMSEAPCRLALAHVPMRMPMRTPPCLLPQVLDVCSTGEEHLVVSYSRKPFQQTGDGHFSPVGGYHMGRDLVLILDVVGGGGRWRGRSRGAWSWRRCCEGTPGRRRCPDLVHGRGAGKPGRRLHQPSPLHHPLHLSLRTPPPALHTSKDLV